MKKAEQWLEESDAVKLLHHPYGEADITFIKSIQLDAINSMLCELMQKRIEELEKHCVVKYGLALEKERDELRQQLAKVREVVRDLRDAIQSDPSDLEVVQMSNALTDATEFLKQTNKQTNI